MEGNEHRISTSRMVKALALLALVAGALLFFHESRRLESARTQASAHSEEVHLSTRIFVDWLDAGAVDRKLDAMTLRRVALLEVARATRAQNTAALCALTGALLFLLANAARSLREGVVRLPDTSLDIDPRRKLDSKASRTRSRKPRGHSPRSSLELLRQPMG